MEEAKCIDHLSDEMLLKIFQYLTDLKDLLTLRSVNKRIASVAMDNVFTKHVIVTRQYHVTTGMLNSFISPIVDKINSLDLNFCYWIELKDLHCLLSCQNLHTLHMMQVRVEEVFLCDILSHLPNLTSLYFSVTHIGKLQHQLSLCQTARDSLSRIRRLGLHFCHGQYISNPTLEAVDGSSFLEIFKCLEEIHVYGSRYSPCRVRSFNFVPGVMDASIFSNLKVMSLNYSDDARAKRFFFGILRNVCMGDIQLNTLLQPTYIFNFVWGLEDYKVSLKNMTSLIHLDICGASVSIPGDFFHSVTARNLVYLNLSCNTQADPESLRFLSQSCPQLVSVNLQSCYHIFHQPADPLLESDEDNPLVKDLTGIESLVLNCIRLKHLNIIGPHHHTPPGLRSKPFKTLSQILASNPNWHSLALSPCCLFPDDNNLNRDRQDADGIRRCSNCHLPLTERLNSSEPLCTCRSTRAGPELEKLIRATPDMKNFELCCPNYPLAFDMPYGNPPPVNLFHECLDNKILSDYELACTSAWSKLTSLKLTGIEGVDLGVLLWALAKGCLSLEKLSIACYSSDRMNLDVTSYPSFSRLRDFRLEHPYVSANRYLVSSLAQCPNIERICMVSCIQFPDDAIKRLFEVSTKLICFQLYILKKTEECQGLQEFLIEKYSGSRPALRVCIQDAVSGNLHQVVRDELPEVHIDEMTIVQSSVAAVPS